MPKAERTGVVATNRKARHTYDILETFVIVDVGPGEARAAQAKRIGDGMRECARERLFC